MQFSNLNRTQKQDLEVANWEILKVKKNMIFFFCQPSSFSDNFVWISLKYDRRKIQKSHFPPYQYNHRVRFCFYKILENEFTFGSFLFQHLILLHPTSRAAWPRTSDLQTRQPRTQSYKQLRGICAQYTHTFAIMSNIYTNNHTYILHSLIRIMRNVIVNADTLTPICTD